MPIKTEADLDAAVAQMRAAGTDLAIYEVKSAKGGFPKDAYATFSAFANTSGGTIIFGITEKGFHSVPGLDIKALQSSCAQAARDLMEPPIAAEILVLSFEENPVVVVNVPESDKKQKPCFVKKLGRIGGSYIRTGDGDHKLSLYEIDRLMENQYRSAVHDCWVIPDATLDDLDADLLDGWLAHARRASFNRMADMTDETVMANRRVIGYDAQGVAHPTVAGIMSLGSFPQKFFPRLNVIFTAYSATRKDELGSSAVRYTDAANIEGPIPEMLVDTLRALSNNMRHGAIVKGGLREDISDYPLVAVREAVANALMHRDYSPDAQGSPVCVDLYPDRLEITNPGGLYGSLTVDELGKRGVTVSRNQFLSTVLADVPYTDIDGTTGHVVENRGTGYPIITNELERALMGKPVVISNLSEFKIIFRHRGMTEQESSTYSRSNVSEAILSYIAERESASTAEVASSAGISQKTARGYINDLIAEGVVEGIGSKYSPKRRYRIVR